MITILRSDLLSSDAEALVNAVNCKGVMGRGIAAQFRQGYPEMFVEYRRKCLRGELQPGSVWARRWGEKWVVNAVTKDHWRNPSQLAWIESCAERLRAFVGAANVKSIAIPALGCGLGGLDWTTVRGILENSLQGLPADVRLYEPE